jgi:uncharacterized membrane protein
MAETHDPHALAPTSDDKVMPAVVYALYLIGLINGVTIIIGLVIAYVARDRAGPLTRSHYVFQTRSCWMGLAIAFAASLVTVVGFILSFVIIGLPILWVGLTVLAGVGVWFGLRAVIGLFYLVQDQPYPRPDSWLI